MKNSTLIKLTIGIFVFGGIGYLIGAKNNSNKEYRKLPLNFRNVMEAIFVPDNVSIVEFEFHPKATTLYKTAGSFTITLRDRYRQVVGAPVKVENIVLNDQDFNYFQKNNNSIELPAWAQGGAFTSADRYRRRQRRTRR